MDEIELKFEVPPSRRAAVMAAMKRGRVTEQRLQAHYFDTADELLARHRMALRLRKEGRQWVQTLKGATSDSMRRLEHNAPVVSLPGHRQPAIDVSLHDGTPAGAALQEVMRTAMKKVGKGGVPTDANMVASPLESRYGTDVRRTSRVVRSGSSRVEVAFDVGWIIAGEERLHLCEVEFELKGGSVADLLALARRWVTEHGLWLDTASKAERGVRLARGTKDLPATKAQALRLPADASAADALREIVANCMAQVTGNAGPVAAGSHDDEHIHQLRVGIRRLRTVLREMADADSAIDERWELVLKEAFQALGDYRDQKVVVDHIEPRLVAAGAPPARHAARQAARQADREPNVDPATPALPSAIIAAPLFQGTLLELLAFCVPQGAPKSSASPAHAEQEKILAKTFFKRRLSKLERQVTRDGERFLSLSEADRHRVRKRLKRLRYVAEFAGSLFGRKNVEQYLDALRPAQDVLGDHNDEVVALHAYARNAAADPHAAFATGWLSARQDAGAQRCQRALEQVARTDRFWKKQG